MPVPEKRPIGTALTLVVLAIFAALVAGAVYERVERRQDRLRFPQIGRSIDIGGRTLNIYCSGEGAPAVILESPPPMPGYSWAFVQPEIAKFTRACWYDRAGYGWSDPGPNPRDGAAIANDLHELLRAAEVRRPYVLVGATFGALYARVYSRLYPGDAAGIVLVDPVRADEATDPKSKGPVPQFLHWPRSLLAQGFNQVGLVRLLDLGARTAPPATSAKGLTPQEWAVVWGLRNEPKNRTALLQELATDFSAEERAAGSLGNMPLIVLVSGSADDNSDKLSAQGKLVVVADGGNAIQLNAPDAVIEAARELVAQLR